MNGCISTNLEVIPTDTVDSVTVSVVPTCERAT